jgi:hypothetical protein
MHTSLLFLPIIIHNTDLTLTFSRIEKLELFVDHMYFPLKYGSKIVERFSSLRQIQINCYSLDSSLPIVDIFLCGLPKLRHAIIEFCHDTLLDNPISRDHVIENRRQSFG